MRLNGGSESCIVLIESLRKFGGFEECIAARGCGNDVRDPFVVDDHSIPVPEIDRRQIGRQNFLCLDVVLTAARLVRILGRLRRLRVRATCFAQDDNAFERDYAYVTWPRILGRLAPVAEGMLPGR